MRGGDLTLPGLQGPYLLKNTNILAEYFRIGIRTARRFYENPPYWWLRHRSNKDIPAVHIEVIVSGEGRNRADLAATKQLFP